jgi:hypothetical protein
VSVGTLRLLERCITRRGFTFGSTRIAASGARIFANCSALAVGFEWIRNLSASENAKYQVHPRLL